MVWRGRVTRKHLLGGGDLIFKRRFEIFKKKGGGVARHERGGGKIREVEPSKKLYLCIL